MRSTTIVKKWGSSLAVVIPHDLAKAHNLQLYDVIEFEIKKVRPL